MRQARCRELYDIKRLPMDYRITQIVTVRTGAKEIEEEVQELQRCVTKAITKEPHASTEALSAPIQIWTHSLRQWAARHEMIKLSPVEQKSLLVILEQLKIRVKASLEAPPDWTEVSRIAVSAHR